MLSPWQLHLIWLNVSGQRLWTFRVHILFTQKRFQVTLEEEKLIYFAWQLWILTKRHINKIKKGFSLKSQRQFFLLPEVFSCISSVFVQCKLMVSDDTQETSSCCYFLVFPLTLTWFWNECDFLLLQFPFCPIALPSNQGEGNGGWKAVSFVSCSQLE